MGSQTQQILTLNSFDGRAGAALPDDVGALVARRRRSFGAGSVLFYQEPLHIVSARGAVLTAADGRDYLDLYNNVPSVGHCHPRVVEAVSRQMAVLNVHTRYLFDVVHDYAEQLLACFPDALSNVVLMCTGSEANDFALRLARLSSGGTGFVVTEAAYHGNTLAVTEVSPSSYKKGRPPAHVRTVPPPDPRRFGGDAAAGFGRAVAQAIAELEADGIRFAGLLVDTIFSSDGVFAEPEGLLAPAVAAARAAGGLFIADEVQPGFGRTGEAMWGFARHKVVPDVVTMGKPMGNGIPLAGVVTRPDLLSLQAEAFGYFNTFGGNPVSAAAGLAVLRIIEEEGLMENARLVGGHIRQGLEELGRIRRGLGQVRGSGLYLGLDILDEDGGPDCDGATAVINGLRERGVLIGAAGPHGNVLKIRPPLCLDLAQADLFLAALEAVCA